MKVKKLLTILSLLIVVLIVALAAYAYAYRTNPILYRVEDNADPVKTPLFLFLNPFRDRSAEIAASLFLEELKANRCQQAVESLFTESPESRQYICEREAKYRLESWSLANLEEQPSQTRLYFWNKRNVYDAQNGQLWVTVAKHGNQWKVVDYETWY